MNVHPLRNENARQLHKWFCRHLPDPLQLRLEGTGWMDQKHQVS